MASLRSTASSPLLRRTDGAGLAAQIAVVLAVVLAVNGVIAVVPGASDDDRPRSALLPPGAVVGTVWVVLFAGMTTARWLLLRRGADRDAIRAVWVLALACLVYPVYSGLITGSRVPGLVGSVLTTGVAVWAFALVRRVDPGAAAAVAAVLAWLAYATVGQADTLLGD